MVGYFLGEWSVMPGRRWLVICGSSVVLYYAYFEKDFKAVNTSIASICCERSILVIISQRDEDQAISGRFKKHVRKHVLAIVSGDQA